MSKYRPGSLRSTLTWPLERSRTHPTLKHQAFKTLATSVNLQTQNLQNAESYKQKCVNSQRLPDKTCFATQQCVRPIVPGFCQGSVPVPCKLSSRNAKQCITPKPRDPTLEPISLVDMPGPSPSTVGSSRTSAKNWSTNCPLSTQRQKHLRRQLHHGTVEL